MSDVIVLADIVDLRHIGSALTTIEGRAATIERNFESVVVLLEQLVQLETKMSVEFEAALADLSAKVTNVNDVVGSAVLLIQDLAQLITEQANDPAQVAELAATLQQTADNLAAAVAANTVPEPTP